MKRTQIFAMGGGGFSEETDSKLDDYILGLAGKRRPKVCFLATASGDSQGYIDKFFSAFPRERAHASFLPLFRIPVNLDLKKHILDQDILYVGGGNTVNLLSIWRLHRVDKFIKMAMNRGTILSGISAGMLCWYQEMLTDSFGKVKPFANGLGFVKGSACPHYDRDDRGQVFERAIRAGKLSSGVAAEDCVGLHHVGGRLHAVVSSVRNKAAYRMEGKGRDFTIERIAATRL